MANNNKAQAFGKGALYTQYLNNVGDTKANFNDNMIDNNKALEIQKDTTTGKIINDPTQTKFGGGDWAKMGLATAGLASNIALGVRASALAERQFEAEQIERDRRNKAYEYQKQRNENATNDTANTASGLQSASGEMQGTREAAPQEPQEQRQELPMERQ